MRHYWKVFPGRSPNYCLSESILRAFLNIYLSIVSWKYISGVLISEVSRRGVSVALEMAFSILAWS